MTNPLSCHWLPTAPDLSPALAAIRLRALETPTGLAEALVTLSRHDLDFLQINRLDRLVRTHLPVGALPSLRLAILATHTVDHLLPAIRVAALRRDLAVETWVAPYGQLRQSLTTPELGLERFRPDAVLILTDAATVVPHLPLTAARAEAKAAVDREAEGLLALVRTVRDRLSAVPILATALTTLGPLFGEGEALMPASPANLLADVNAAVRSGAAAAGAVLLDLDRAAAMVGVERVHDPRLWHHAKQLVQPPAAPWFGERVARLLGALRGRSRKVLVLDLDNTLWGGVVGDDGVDGLVLGQGSGEGEAFVAFQRLVLRLRERGVLLAVSSKNDHETAQAPFMTHPDMVLRLKDFAAFEANWSDKPSAVRRIAADLSLGLDALVFFDDNPAERALMRRTLPAVQVLEVPEAPDLYVRCLVEAGCFETVAFTADDAARAGHYAANSERRRLEASATDLDAYLRELAMTLRIDPFRSADIPRIAQLINKTNQFNLTTRRYTEAEVTAMASDPGVIALSARLSDRFGDNGLIAIMIGRMVCSDDAAVEIDSWLMSCRVLGRQVEAAMLDRLAERARAAGARTLVGVHRPTARNGMVADLYARLGFRADGEHPDGGSRWCLSLDGRQQSGALAFFKVEEPA